MKTNFRGADKPLFPFLHNDLYRLIDEDHLIFFLSQVLSDYDLSPILNSYRADNIGRSPFDPGKMVLLLVFAYCRGSRSSREIERLFEDSLGARAIFPADPPDHTTINRFRKDHEEALAALLLHTIEKAKECGLIDPTVGIVDGTKMKGNASLSRNESEIAKIDREIEALDHAERMPVPEDLPPHTVAARKRGRKSRRERREEARKKLDDKQAKNQARLDEQKKNDEERARIEAETGKKTRGRKRKQKSPEETPVPKVNLTDPESEIMKTSKGYMQGYNAQIVVTRHQIIIAASVTTEQNDLHQLTPMISEALSTLETIGYDPGAMTTFLADAGYFRAANLQANPSPTLEILCPPARTSRETKETLAAYKDHPENSPLAGHPRTTAEGMAHYLGTAEGKARYKIRGTTVEPTFGQIKENRKTRGFMRRGKKACQAEWKLISAIHNLQKIRQHVQDLKKSA